MSIKYNRYKKWGSIVVEVPDKMQYTTKNGKIKEAEPVTKTRAIATRNGEKAIKLINFSNEKEKLKEVEHITKNDEAQIKKIIDELENLKKNLNAAGHRNINRFIKKFKEEKEIKVETMQKLLDIIKKEINNGRWGKDKPSGIIPSLFV